MLNKWFKKLMFHVKLELDSDYIYLSTDLGNLTYVSDNTVLDCSGMSPQKMQLSYPLSKM